MIATRFRSVGWTGCICAAALSFYMVSQTVASKRAELVKVDRQIASTQREIGQLETEISTRGGLTQIEAWNSHVYGLQAPGAEQFVKSTVQLVAMADPQPLPLDPAISPPHGPVQQASLTIPTAPPVARAADPVDKSAADPVPVEQPMLRQATYIQPKRPAMAPGNADVQKTSYEVPVDPKALGGPAADKQPTEKHADRTHVVKEAVKPTPSKGAVAKSRAADKPETVAKVTGTKKAAPVKLTSLDDSWLTEVNAEPKSRSRKGRP